MKEFIERVRAMRAAQKAYEKTPCPETRIRAKRMASLVDDALKWISEERKDNGRAALSLGGLDGAKN